MTSLETTFDEQRQALLGIALRVSRVRFAPETEVLVVDVGDRRGAAFASRLRRQPVAVVEHGLRPLAVFTLGVGELGGLAWPWWPRNVARTALTGGEIRVGCFALGGLSLGCRLAAARSPT